jgi:hypothetical protein
MDTGRPASPSAAILQGAILAGTLVLIAGALLVAHRRPFDADTLKIETETLQSQAAEFEATRQLAQRGVLSARWTTNHLGQLQEHVQQSRSALESKQAPPMLEATRARAQATAATLDDRLTHARNHPVRVSP